MGLLIEGLRAVPHATAQELYDWVAQSHPGQKIGLTTIYRVMNYLMQENQVKRVFLNDTQARYDLIESHPHAHHHHHVVCTQCQKVEILEECPIEPALEQLQSRFKVLYHNMELFGVCQTCQD